MIERLSKKLTIAIPISLLLGLLYGISFNPASLKKLLIPLTFIMVYPMMINLNWEKLLKGKDSKVMAVAQGVNFVLVPTIAILLSTVFFRNNPYMALGLFLSSLFPTSGMTITWTGLSKGNVEAAIKLTLVGLTLGSLLSPFYLRFAMGKVIPVDMVEIFKQILVIIIIPLALGYITKLVLINLFGEQVFKQKIAKKLPPISTLGVLGIVFVAMAVKSKSIVSNPFQLAYALLPVLLLYLLNVLVVTLIARKFFNYEDAVSIVFGTVARNLSIALALAINAFGEKGSDAALVISAAFIIQAQTMAWYSKLTSKILKKNESSLTILEGERANA
ncbi:MAG: bile acid:sodium symporter [Actinobacteria bacterium]|nr:bile acid:sodium symporter [Actinomycetota bacterium]